MNNIHKQLDFKMMEEINNTANYLDLHVHRIHGEIQPGIYRKPTQTDTTIHFTSNHPLQHKLAAYIFYINILLSTPITEQEKKHEWNTICTMAKNNGFPLQLIYNLRHKLTHTQHNTTQYQQTNTHNKENVDNIYIPQPSHTQSY
jgi:site-specific DNA-adenine methylase